MKVILRDDIPELGKAGETIEVKSGYGRNYLIPKNLAIPATRANLLAIGEVSKQKDIRDKKLRRGAEIIKEKIEKLSLSAEVMVGEEEKLFGSITSMDVVRLLSEQGITIDKRAVQLEEPIKALGIFTIPIKVERDVIANVKMFVIKKS